MRVFPTSRGLEPADLRPGADLVLEVAEAHGLDLPRGVLVHDHLPADLRGAIDDAAPGVLGAWSDRCADELTLDGLNLAWLWETELLAGAVLPALVEGLGVRRALALTGGEQADRRPAPPLRRAARASRARRALSRLARIGVPSRVRRGAILVLPYWTLVPAVDRMLDERLARVAVIADRRPASPRRTLRCLRSGGWVGLPGPWRRRRGRRRAQALADAFEARRSAPLYALGVDLAPALRAATLRLLRERAADDLARLDVLRAPLARLRRVVVSDDAEPLGRLVTWAAQAAGVPVTMLQHGAYFLDHPVLDMEVADEVLVWGDPDRLPPRTFRAAPRIVGYPGPHAVAGPPAPGPLTLERIAVLAYGRDPYTARLDGRHVLAHLVAALEAVRAAAPRAEVMLRPHPAADRAGLTAAIARVPGLAVTIDRTTDIVELLGGADLCVGTPSTATLQAALAGTPVVVLNVTGYGWAWPLGQDTDVPVARSADELAAALRDAQAIGPPPGHETLLAALGAGTASPRIAVATLTAAADERQRAVNHEAGEALNLA